LLVLLHLLVLLMLFHVVDSQQITKAIISLHRLNLLLWSVIASLLLSLLQ